MPAKSDPKEGGRRPSRQSLTLRIAVQVAAVAIVAFFFYRERHLFAGFASTLGRVTWYWVVLAFLAELASIPPLAEAQLIVLRAGGTKADRWQMILVTLASNAISMSAPLGVAIAEGYAFTQYRRLGASAAVAAWAELASGAIAFAALAGVALAGALIAGGPALGILLPILSIVFAGAVAAAQLFRHPHVLIRAIDWIEQHVGRHLGRLVSRASQRVRDISHRLSHVHPSAASWIGAGALSALNWLLDVVCLALSFQAVGSSIPWGPALVAFAGAKVVSSIGITPGGLGIVDGGLVATFVAYGAQGSTAAAAVLVYRGLTLIGLVAIGWIASVLLAGGRREIRHHTSKKSA